MSALWLLWACGGSLQPPEADADADTDTDTDSDSDADADSDTDTDGDTDADADSDTDADTDADADSDTDADADSDTDADADSDTDADADSDTDADADSDTDADTDSDTDADCLEESEEPNNSISTAGLAGTTQLGAAFSDLDYWEIEVPPATSVQVNLIHDNSQADLDLTLFDDFSIELDRSAGYFADVETVAYDNISNDPQLWYAEVENASFFADCGDYELEVLTTCWEDEEEPNEIPGSAVRIYDGTETYALNDDSDVDYWIWELTDESIGTVTIEFDHGLGNLDLFLYHDGVQVDSSEGITDSETVSWENTNLVFNEDLVIEVRGIGGLDCGTYTLTTQETVVP